MAGPRQVLSVLEEGHLDQWLGKDVSHHLGRGYIVDFESAHVTLLAEVVICYLDVLGRCPLCRVVGLADCPFAVAPQFEDWPLHAQLFRQMTLECALTGARCSGDVFAVVGAGGDIGV